MHEDDKMVKVVIPISLRPLFRKRLEIATWLQGGTYRKWNAWYRMVTWSI